jgi:hypothetical protein
MVSAAVERLTLALGEPVATPEWVEDANRNRVGSQFRVWRWRCPACGAGEGDPIYRPLVVDSDGRVRCEAHDCTMAEIREAVDARINVDALLRSIGVA